MNSRALKPQTDLNLGSKARQNCCSLLIYWMSIMSGFFPSSWNPIPDVAFLYEYPAIASFRVEIPLENRSRFERFERFSSKIWAVWAVWAVFLEKPLKPLKSCLKKPLKNRSFLAVIFERFFNQDLSGFWAVFERSSLQNSSEHVHPGATNM